MAYFSLLIYTSLIYIRPQDIYQELYGVTPPPILPVVLVLTLVLSIVTRQLSMHRLFSLPQSKLLFGFFGACMLSQLIHLRFRGAWEASYLFSNVVVLYVFIVCLLNTPGKIKGYVVLLVILTFFLAYQGIEQYRTGTSWGGHTAYIIKDEVRIRWVGIFDDPNDLACALLLAVPFLLFFLVSQKPFLLKVASAGILVSILYAIFLTRSRGGFLALGAIFYIFFFTRYKGIKFALMGGVGFCFLFLLLPERMTSSVAGGDFVDYGRVGAWSSGMEMLKSSPIFGVGQGLFPEYHERAAHNSYVEVMAEIGIVGMFLWVALIYITLRDGYKMNKMQSMRQLEDPHCLTDIGMSVFLALLGFLSIAFFLSRAYNVLLYILIGVWVATASMLREDNDNLNFKFEANDFLKVAGLILGFILFLYVGVRFLWSAR